MNNKFIKDDEINLRAVFQVYKKSWTLFLSCTLISIVICIAIGLLLPKWYISTAIISIGTSGGKLIEPIEGIVKVLESNINPPGLIHPDSLKEISFYYYGNSLVIEAEGYSPEEAYMLTKSSVDYLMKKHEKLYQDLLLPIKLEILKTDNDIRKVIEKLSLGANSNKAIRPDIIEGYINSLSVVKETKAILLNNISQYIPTKMEISPIKPKHPAGPKLLFIVFLSASLGLFIGSIIVFVIKERD